MAMIIPPQIFQALRTCRALEKSYAEMKQGMEELYRNTVSLRTELEEAAADLRGAAVRLHANSRG